MAPTAGRLDTASVAGAAVFSTLALVLGAASQAFGLNFPIIPYLQFDFGEVAIILAFFVFGPVPALLSSFVEFGGLMVYGQQVPIGPLLKLFALLSSVAGLWVGSKVAAKVGTPSLRRLVGGGALSAAVVRALVMTVPNFYLLEFYYSPSAIQGLVQYVLQPSFSLVGIGVTATNFLVPVLAFTAVFNVLQLALVTGVTYFVLKVPVMSQIKVGGRVPWFATIVQAPGTSPENLR